MPNPLTAAALVQRLKALASPDEQKKYQRYFKTGPGDYGDGDVFMGVRMGSVFALAKEFIDLPPAELNQLLDSPLHEVRAGALSIMDKQARQNKTAPERRQELYNLYLRRMDRINNWDLVDLAAPFVVGGYLFDKSRAVLYKLARSKNLWERRTAIVATAYFIRQGDVADTFKIAELLVHDDQDLIHKAVGGWLRAAGGVDPQRLLAFLDQHAPIMPRTALRYAIEHLTLAQRRYYLSLKPAP
jgi:3-methyladenine DNA glycosylase AlkD